MISVYNVIFSLVTISLIMLFLLLRRQVMEDIIRPRLIDEVGFEPS